MTAKLPLLTLLSSLLAPAAAAPRPRAPAPAPLSLRAYVLKTQVRQAYGLYFQGHKVGWFLWESRLGNRDGREVAIHSAEFHLTMRIRDMEEHMEHRETQYFALVGLGSILFDEEHERENEKETTRTGTPQGKEFVIVTQNEGGTTERRVPLPKETLDGERRLYLWLTRTPRKGATLSDYSTSLGEAVIDTPEVLTYQGKRTLAWGGVRTTVYRVLMKSQGAVFDAEVLADGTPIKGRLGGSIDIRAEEEVTARKLDSAGLDMLMAPIPAGKDLGDPREVTSLTLELRGLGDFTPPASDRQRVRLRPPGAAIVQLLRDRRLPRPMPLPAEQRASFLQATPALQADAEPIRSLAREVVGDERDPVKGARLIAGWVYRNLRKSMSANATTALAVLASRAGDCTEHTLLFVALARAAGIPTREVSGLVYTSEERPGFGWHAWAEIHDGTQWVSIDPTWDEVYVDATHVKFSDRSDDYGWIQVLGRLKLKVVQFRRSGG
jgi:hypothetical protein